MIRRRRRSIRRDLAGSFGKDAAVPAVDSSIAVATDSGRYPPPCECRLPDAALIHRRSVRPDLADARPVVPAGIVAWCREQRCVERFGGVLRILARDRTRIAGRAAVHQATSPEPRAGPRVCGRSPPGGALRVADASCSIGNVRLPEARPTATDFDIDPASAIAGRLDDAPRQTGTGDARRQRRGVAHRLADAARYNRRASIASCVRRLGEARGRGPVVEDGQRAWIGVDRHGRRSAHRHHVLAARALLRRRDAAPDSGCRSSRGASRACRYRPPPGFSPHAH